jgi:hypothetical protein
MTTKLRVNLYLMLIIFLSAGVLTSCKDSKDTSEGDTKNGETAGEDVSSKELDLSENFIITYDLQGVMQGKMKLFRQGKKLKQEIESEIMGKKSSNQVYIDGENAYVVTAIDEMKMGTKLNMSDYNEQKQTGETITDPKEFEEFLNSKNKTGTETILGKETDVYDVGNNTKLSVYKNMYVLKISSPEFQAVATDIQINPSFSTDEFTVPTDVDFITMGDMPKDMKNLKNLDSMMEKFKR